jgi:hypothetical protein
MPLNSSLIGSAKFIWVKPNCNLENNRYGVFSGKITNKSVVAQGGGKDFEMFAGL